MRDEIGREYPGERPVADAEAAGIGAERRHDGAFPVACKTAPLHGTATRRDPRLWMQVTCDFSDLTCRLMAEYDPAQRHLGCDHAAEIARQRRIVVAGNPDPVAPRLQSRK